MILTDLKSNFQQQNEFHYVATFSPINKIHHAASTGFGQAKPLVTVAGNCNQAERCIVEYTEKVIQSVVRVDQINLTLRYEDDYIYITTEYYGIDCP